MSNWLHRVANRIPVYRGVDAQGLSGLRITEGGVYGDGVYFYSDPHSAKSHATYPGGGVLTGYVDTDDIRVEVHGKVVLVKDVSAVELRGKIPLDDTLLESREWEDRTQRALNE